MAERTGPIPNNPALRLNETMPAGRESALEEVCSDRLVRHGLYVRIPCLLFSDSSDREPPPPILYPPPSISYYEFKHEKITLWRDSKQSVKPTALRGFDHIWIREEDLPAIRKFAEQLLVAAKGPVPGLPAPRRAEIIHKSAVMVVEDLFQNPSPENLTRSTKMVGSFVQLLMADPRAYLVLANLSSHDPYTLQHSVGTAVNSVILARKAGFSTESQLMEAGMAGLLHDIGKVKISTSIINKEGPLNESEWQEMRRHPELGYEIVKNNKDITERSKRAILEHHEDRVGTGYPRKLKAEDLDRFSLIVGLSDVFNALTTNRSYSKARTPFEAFELIRDKMIHKVDPELFSALVLIYGGKF